MFYVKTSTDSDGEEFEGLDDAADYAQGLNPYVKEGESVWVENEDGDTVYSA